MVGMMPAVDLHVRAARPDDPADGLLYESARAYYDAYAGGEARARRMVRSVYGGTGHTASHDICRVALLGEEVVGVLAGFPVEQGQALARRFLSLTWRRLPPWHWPALWSHLRAARGLAPSPPAGSWYVDALAVARPMQRRGVARALLDDAAVQARAHGAAGISLDTGLENAAAQALYDACGFERRAIRHAPSEAAARAIGGSGFVSYYRGVSPH
jgi:ribosomal protein S18 acetylase RimI-like enzyme